MAQSCFATFCHVPLLCFALHPLHPNSWPPVSLQGFSSPYRAEGQGTLLRVCNLESRLTSMECFAISVEANFTANFSGYHWGHLGVCTVYSNCFTSAGEKKKPTYYHVLAADSGFCVGNLSHQRKKKYAVALLGRKFSFTLQDLLTHGLL